MLFGVCSASHQRELRHLVFQDLNLVVYALGMWHTASQAPVPPCMPRV